MIIAGNFHSVGIISWMLALSFAAVVHQKLAVSISIAALRYPSEFHVKVMDWANPEEN